MACASTYASFVSAHMSTLLCYLSAWLHTITTYLCVPETTNLGAKARVNCGYQLCTNLSFNGRGILSLSKHHKIAHMYVFRVSVKKTVKGTSCVGGWVEGWVKPWENSATEPEKKP